jgi:Tetratricopeptide repeat
MIGEDHMASERDIANRLPEPPAPSPEARDAAIAEALLRFDQLHRAPARDSGARLRQAGAVPPWRVRLATPAVRYLAAASVMLFIAVPAAWLSLTEIQRRDEPQFASPPAQDRVATMPPQTETPNRSVGDRRAVPVAPPSEPQPAPPQPLARQDDRSAAALGSSEPRPAPSPPAAQAERRDPPAVASKAVPPAPAESRARRELGEPLAAPGAAPPSLPAAPQPLARQQVPSAGASGGQGEWAACRAGDPDRKIVGCTRIIEDRARGTSDRRAALLERGEAFARRDELDRAIADFSESIRLQGGAAAHVGRGIAYQRKGELDRAIADFTEAIRLEPGNAAAFYNRSLAYRAKGDRDPADADLTRARALGRTIGEGVY